MSAAKSLVTLLRPNGSKQTQLTNVVPVVGDFVRIAAVEFKVRARTCCYESVDGKQDHYVVHLEATR